jgi:hypothetical protein
MCLASSKHSGGNSEMSIDESVADWSAIEDDFKRRGFLGLGTEQFERHFRSVMSDWFGLAENLNELGQRIYVESSHLIHGKPVLSEVPLCLQMMPRCLSAFQGSLILAERGLGIEAQMLVRSIFETAFWMGYISADPKKAIPRFRKETLDAEIRLFEASFRYLKVSDPEIKVEAAKQLRQMRNDCEGLPGAPHFEKLARLVGYAQTYFFYTQLSGAATHTTFMGHQIGPDEDAVGHAVWLGCRAMMLAIDALQRVLSVSDFDAELKASSGNGRLNALWPFSGGQGFHHLIRLPIRKHPR